MARLAAAFPNSKPDKMTTQMYYELLRDIPADELKWVVDSCIASPFRVFPPTIGEIRGEWKQYRENRPIKFKQLEAGKEGPYVPMPQACKDELNAFFKKKGFRTKYRDLLENEFNRLAEA